MKKILLLVSVFVLGLTLSACNPTETDKPDECPAGQELKDGNCVTVDPVCTGDEVLIGGECVLDELTCDAPYVPVFGQCVLPYDELDRDVVGRIDLMLWSGSGTYWADMGKQDLTTECAPDAPIDCVPDLTAQNDAAAYAVAKAFNAINEAVSNYIDRASQIKIKEY